MKTKSSPKTVTKSAVKPAPKSDIKVADSPVSVTPPQSQVKNVYLLIAIVFMVLVAAGLYFKNQFIVATVNGKPISRLALIKELEKQGGKKVLDDLITETLIQGEAVKQNATVSNDEVNQEIVKIEEQLKQQNRNLDDVLKTQGMDRATLITQIKTQKLVEKLALKSIPAVTDKDIDDYIAANKDSFPKEATTEEIRSQVKSQLEQQKKSEAAQTWLTSLREKAKISYFLNFN
jgi:parvulin-like peptidyl-prolyl isomerase